MEIDLSGPGGNAYALMAITRRVGVELGLESYEIIRLLDEMKNSGTYANLLDVMDSYFPGLFVFINDPRVENK